MLLTISTTHRPATDLGFLLHKSPDTLHTFDLPFGQAHVFYPEASDERATAAFYLEVDAVGLVRHGRGPAHLRVDEYVNDRPYVASSLLAVALSKVYGTALNGRSKMRPELVGEPLPLEVTLSAVPVGRGVLHGPEDTVRRLFEPMGWNVDLEDVPLDPRFPDWGRKENTVPSGGARGENTGPYVRLTLRGRQTLADTLRQLYVLVPVLDASKHYWVNHEEADKLVRHGGAWLAAHPERDAVVGRYLRHQEKLVRAALEGLRDKAPRAEEKVSVRDAVHDERRDTSEDDLEEPMKLNEQRLAAVHGVLRASGARRVLDLGCGSGKLLQRLAADEAFHEVVGVDVSARELRKARRHFQDRRRVGLLQGSLTYRDRRLAGYDAAALVEVVEHVEPGRLAAFEDAVFAVARPATVVLTTPNIEYNVLFESLVAGRGRPLGGNEGGKHYRHEDHRFEWTRREFAAWAEGVAERQGYTVRFDGVGPVHPEHGAPTQMAVFTVQARSAGESASSRR